LSRKLTIIFGGVVSLVPQVNAIRIVDGHFLSFWGHYSHTTLALSRSICRLAAAFIAPAQSGTIV